jgi:hypothetical protein
MLSATHSAIEAMLDVATSAVERRRVTDDTSDDFLIRKGKA